MTALAAGITLHRVHRPNTKVDLMMGLDADVFIRLNKSEVLEVKARLAEWQTPDAMAAEYDRVRCQYGPVAVIQSGLAFLRDAHMAAVFGKARKAEKVRLVADTWPDFELLVDGRVEAFEAVEADRPGRQRGREYVEDKSEVRSISTRDLISRAEAAPSWIETACRNKAAKHYVGHASLVVYLNMNEFGVRQKQVEDCFGPATRIARDAFESIWVLWKGRAYAIW